MNLTRALFVGLLTSLCAAAAFSSPCNGSGMTALRADDGGGYLFYVFREGPDIYFAINGEKISFPEGTDGPRRFVVDGIFYESLLVKPSEFMKPELGISELEILKKHKAYDFDFLQKSGTPLKQAVELGPQVKPPAAGQPSFTFFLWKAVDPKNENGTRQYFLTTVSGGDVVVLTAIVPNQAADDKAMAAFQTYAGSFQHVLKKEQCPEETSAAAASSDWRRNGEPVADGPDRKSVNGFGGHLLIVENPQAFIQEWVKPETPQIATATAVKRGVLFGGFVLFVGCKPDTMGVCNAEVDYLLYKPDGSLYAERKRETVWKDTAPPAGYIQLSKSILGFRIEPKDPAGEYTVKARVSDLNAKISFELETKFRVK
jgi:hypothetical protein